MADVIWMIFFFALGACVGSFLNVVVGRFPLSGDRSWLAAITAPPSHCPKCQHRLAWYDNIPVFGWFLLRGRCRYCRKPISFRYPAIEALCGGLFAFYYFAFFVLHIGPCAAALVPTIGSGLTNRIELVPRMPESLMADWPIYLLCMYMISALLVATLIDAQHFVIPLSLPWLMAGVGFAVHALMDAPNVPGAVNAIAAGRASPGGAAAAGGAVGLMISILLLRKGIIPVSFPEGEPTLERDRKAMEAAGRGASADDAPGPISYSPAQVRAEMRKEMLFLLPPLALGAVWTALSLYVPAIASLWQGIAGSNPVSGLLGAVLGALVGGLVVWLARIFGSVAFGREAMGLGDVHLMFGVGAIIGAGPATVAFFLAPFAGLAIGLYMWISRNQRELPYGPYLSLASAAVLLCYCPIAEYLGPGIQGMGQVIRAVLPAGFVVNSAIGI